MTVRIPVGLLHTVGFLTSVYRVTQCDLAAIAFQELHKRAKTAKPTRNWTEFNKYKEEIESVCPIDWLEQFDKPK